MKTRTKGAITPFQKNIGINERLGNTGIKKQQGTTRILYDMLALDGRTQFEFFKESNNRNFPFTNTGADGNRLGVGESLVIERAYLSVVTIDDAGVQGVNTLVTAGLNEILVGELNVEIGNVQVLKQMPVLSTIPFFNKSAYHEEDYNFEFDTQLVIPPLIEYVLRLRSANYTPLTDTYLRLTIEGAGAILNTRQTY